MSKNTGEYMSIIIVGDLHLKQKEPFFQVSKQFLNWLDENYREQEMVFAGDIFDSSSPMWIVYKEFKEFLMKRKNYTYIVKGNHDTSKNKGCSLSAFNLIDNVIVYEDYQEVKIQNHKFLILPFIYDYKSFQGLSGEYDFIFTHLMPKEFQFGDEGVEFSKLKGKFIHGHHHIRADFQDRFNNEHIIVGVPYETRNGEAQPHRIIEIKNDKSICEIDVPLFFTHETISYGQEPSNKMNIINVIDAPSKQLVYEKYKEYYIRDTGIKLLRTENTKESFKHEFESANILEKFKKYSQENNLSKEVSEECSSRLSRII